jgi:hypothetical protein
MWLRVKCGEASRDISFSLNHENNELLSNEGTSTREMMAALRVNIRGN